MTLRFDDDTRSRFRKAMLRKGKSIADDLAEILAGKDKPIKSSDLPVSASKPGMRPEERLRAYLDHVESCRRLLDAGDDSYGRCRQCGVDLGLPALEEMPWADRCEACIPEHLRESART